ncbi:hypothetical protein G7B40_018845 [Aetokthonos hydrillicola Thurmond2011]|jgi:hypothetical protein|uniref:Uncharacterized protein n=1 Tax=Aetokthonos hydrillicola Thurmond2011 TaxID=2712845 RepID=A0AAP5IAA3_9CYAN|nr:hypothetical protein [Aetokthonos hydrillicola]MBO3462704.1 hypothetical protein [Aetokthonos hydrillicola CCALA 1050]MBW4585261.1 hypothetical protein [Aetokthonos hydrillicola CCALA 1050]MDR9896604.1 hypothetical protein [Aetokthonos hydrillicola Thurmond2011]
MLKRFLALAIFSTGSAIGLFSSASVLVPSFVEASSSLNTQQAAHYKQTEVLPTQRILIAQSSALTGKWKADDGGVYYIRQVGDKFWWYGEQKETQPAWSNVFTGTISANEINGSWVDVPKGGATGSGVLKLRIVTFSRIEKINGGGFSGSVWTRL